MPTSAGSSPMRRSPRPATTTLCCRSNGRSATLGAADPWTVSPPAGNPRTFVAIVDSGLRRPDGGVPADLGQVEPASVCQTAVLLPAGPRPRRPRHLPGRHHCGRAGQRHGRQLADPAQLEHQPDAGEVLQPRRTAQRRLRRLRHRARRLATLRSSPATRARSSTRAGTWRRAMQVWRPCGLRSSIARQRAGLPRRLRGRKRRHRQRDLPRSIRRASPASPRSRARC